ncbi:sphingolipid delta-4 desaturase [Elasticomyces elasticus]|nr:sphingolipid delta-4 desaturase [Elasticomyces elasticus]
MPSSVATTTIAPVQAARLHRSSVQVQPTGLKQDRVSKPEDDTDRFFWTYTEEPHRTRRQAIIKAHPEVLKLCGPEPLTIPLVLAVLAVQFACAYLLRDTPFLSWRFFLAAYIIGATANQNLFLAIHEISHNLAFKAAWANRLFAVVANLPIGIPYSASFRPYHLTHHKSLGVDGLDTDLPTSLEALFLDSIAGKAFFCTFQILFYALRPMMVYQLPLTKIHAFNVAAQLAFDYVLVQHIGGKALAYLILSSFLAGSLHPCAGHFIAEHYVFNRSAHSTAHLAAGVPVPETFSYYGPLNLLTYNVGLHNEHHDFPAIPWSRLPALHEIAKEFYAELPRHESWVYVIWQFIWDREVGLWCRVKRAEGGRKVGFGNVGEAVKSGRTEAWREEELAGGGKREAAG